jgi:hypothetical protein
VPALFLVLSVSLFRPGAEHQGLAPRCVLDELRDLHTVCVTHDDELTAGNDFATDTEIYRVILVAVDYEKRLGVEFHSAIKSDLRAAENCGDTDLDTAESCQSLCRQILLREVSGRSICHMPCGRCEDWVEPWKRTATNVLLHEKNCQPKARTRDKQ